MEGDLVLVSGASGYVGSWVCKKLQEQGFRVRGTVRDLENRSKVEYLYQLCSYPDYPIELVEANLLEPDGWTQAVKGCKYVMHAASPFVIQNPRDPDELIKPAVDGTLNVLRAAAECGTVERVVVTGSFAACERSGRKTGTYTEDDWSVPENQRSIYARSKTLAEKAAWDFVENLPNDKKFGLSTILPVGILGPALSGNRGESIDMFADIMEGKVPIIPQLTFSFVDVRDVAEAHIRCITTKEAPGKRILVNSELVFYPSLIRTVAEEMNPQGYKIPTKTMPNFVLRILSLFSSSIRTLREIAEIPVSTERFKNVLGIQPIPIKKTLIDMAYSLVEVGRIRKTAQYQGPPDQ
ncbi:hypothetical protein RRG08_047685 [Elysia crispata]|uniref:NAD-dependent epimerase/dehydratase domain-containing protein n=1 Tax=Elysia crispata TaxID=231223 RepID=A0AAE1BEC9_9GAST|nr:hypothetical protein RRG08_047685 [Elysia crispata]